jgi:hypothetical protein
MVRGARSRVQGVTALSTEEVDLTGRTGSFAARLKISLPSALVKIAGEPSVEFRATIQEAVVAKSLQPVQVTGIDLSPRFAPKAPLQTGRVEVQGPQLLVDGVRADQVRLLLDCSAVKRAGVYVLHPRPEAPSGITVRDWEPRELSVEFVPVRQ